MKFLYKVRISPYNNSFNLQCDPLNSTDKKRKTIVFQGGQDRFKLFLKKVGANDNIKQPVSKNRFKTYQKMIDDAISGKDPYVYIWSHKLPKSTIIKEENLIELNDNDKNKILDLEQEILDIKKDLVDTTDDEQKKDLEQKIKDIQDVIKDIKDRDIQQQTESFFESEYNAYQYIDKVHTNYI